MPHLRTVSAARYRSFSVRTSLELRPLTLLYGKNSAGKSALLRLLPLVADAIDSRAGSPLELSRVAGRKGTFHDVVWKGQVEGQRDLELGLRWADAGGIDGATFSIRYSDERKQTLIEDLELLRGGAVELTAKRVPESRESEKRGVPLIYDVTMGGTTEQQTWTFDGLAPKTAGAPAGMSELRDLLTGLRDRIQWIQALRRPPERRNPETGATPRLFTADGSDACEMLRADDELLADVSAWYEAHTGRTMELRDAPPSDYRVLLRPTDAPDVDVDLIDAGEGFIQVFPVLVGLSLARRRAAEGPFILAVEEPESHLHPDRQVALAQKLCAVAAGESPPTTVIETHSFPLMLAIQIEIARGTLPADRVYVYWVEQLEDGSSVASRITFDTLGRPEGPMPSGAFADQRRLAQELQREQSQRSSAR